MLWSRKPALKKKILISVQTVLSWPKSGVRLESLLYTKGQGDSGEQVSGTNVQVGGSTG